MHEDKIKALRETGDPEKLVIAFLLESGFSASLEKTIDYCRRENISPSTYSKALMNMFAMEVAAVCIPQENAIEVGALFTSLFAQNLAAYLTTTKKGDGHG